MGFGGWIALGALREMRSAGRRGHAHSHVHSHDFSNSKNAADLIHGPAQKRFTTDEGELRLSIFERGVPPHFRLSGLPIDIARVETIREDGGRQIFRFENCGAYWQSIEEIPEPHEFNFAVMIDHRGHTHSFEGKFTEHAHDPDGREHSEDHQEGPEHNKLYEQEKGMVIAARHSHIHRHGAGVPHAHWHDHGANTLHVVLEEMGSPPRLHEHHHRTPARTALLLILGSSPMVEGIPAFFAASRYGVGLIIVMATVFGVSTIAAYVLLCVYSTEGLQRVSFGAVERYGEVLSGAFIAFVGLVFWIFHILDGWLFPQLGAIKMRRAAMSFGIAILMALILVLAGTSWAHGIAGNRYFPGTLTFDDPAVADELFLPLYAYLEHPTREGGGATDDAFSLTFLRPLTPSLAVGGDSTWLRRAHDGFSTRTGFGSTLLLIKGPVYENDPHEALISASLIWGIGDFGTKAVGGYGPNTLHPSFTFGKGFGGLPDSLKWLRPFAIAGNRAGVSDQRENENSALRSKL